MADAATIPTRLVITEGLVGTGNAGRLTEFRLGPRTDTTRRLHLEWLEHFHEHHAEPASDRSRLAPAPDACLDRAAPVAAPGS